MQINNGINSINIDVAQKSTEKQVYTGLNNAPLTCTTSFVTREKDSFDRNTNYDTISKDDALMEVWESIHHVINLDGSNDNFKVSATDEDLANLLLHLETNGATEQMNKVDTTKLGSICSYNLETRVDEFVAQYITSKNKSEGNIDEQANLDTYFNDGYNAIVNEFSESLQSAFSLTDAQTQTIKDSFAEIINQKMESYQQSYDNIASNLEDKDKWLLSVDNYMTSAMHVDNSTKTVASDGLYSFDDLILLADVSNYKINTSNELDMGMDLALLSIKVDSMFEQNDISEDMQNLISDVLQDKINSAYESVDSSFDKNLTNDIFNTIMKNYDEKNVSNAIKNSIDDIKSLVSSSKSECSKQMSYKLNTFFNEYARNETDIAIAKYKGENISQTTSSFNDYLEKYDKIFAYRY